MLIYNDVRRFGFLKLYKNINPSQISFLSKLGLEPLTKKSKAFLEIGFSQAKKIISILKSNNINCLKIAKDIQDLDRVLILNKP